MKKTTVICVSSLKGGVGKSETSTTVASILQDKGYKVLLIDADRQCNSTDTYGVSPEGISTLFDVILYHDDPVPIDDAIMHTDSGDIVPGDSLLKTSDRQFLTDSDGSYLDSEFLRLKDAIRGMKTHYDFIIIDTAPNENMVLYNCLAASDLVIIPLLADRYSVQGLSELDILISDIKHSYNKSLKIAGLLLTRFKPGQLLAQEVRKALEGAAKKINTKVFDSYIRESVSVQKAQAVRMPLIRYDDKCNASQDYRKFVDELLGDLK